MVWSTCMSHVAQLVRRERCLCRYLSRDAKQPRAGASFSRGVSAACCCKVTRGQRVDDSACRHRAQSTLREAQTIRLYRQSLSKGRRIGRTCLYVSERAGYGSSRSVSGSTHTAVHAVSLCSVHACYLEQLCYVDMRLYCSLQKNGRSCPRYGRSSNR